jgi:hypothetical protein
MEKIIIFSFLCVLFYIQIEPTLELQPFPPQPPLVDSCQMKIFTSVDQSHDVDNCTAKAQKDWKLKPGANGTSRSDCCANWQITDCLEEAAKVSIIIFHSYFEALILKSS